LGSEGIFSNQPPRYSSGSTR